MLPETSSERYLDGWGRRGDIGVIAEMAGAPCGAAWVRLFAPEERGDGVIARPDTPELAIGVEPAQRGRGTGEAMLRDLLRRAREAGYARIVLSVNPLNPARRLYERCGFVALPEGDPHAGTSVMMEAETSQVEP